MSTNPNIEKATEIIKGQWFGQSFGCNWLSLAGARDSAGLLLTPLHERALKACEDIWVERASGIKRPGVWTVDVCAVVGQESLAGKKPRDSWTAEGEELWLNGKFYVRFFGHAEAKAAQAALNALEAK